VNNKVTSYIEVQLLEQHPIEPLFEGKIFILSSSPYNPEIHYITITRSEEGNYGPSVKNIAIAHGGTIIQSNEWIDWDFVTESGTHFFFPFDTSKFDYNYTINPYLDIGRLRITNRVPGFIINCNTLRAKYYDNDKINIQFTISRSPIIQLFSIVIIIASLMMLFFIVRLEKKEILATAIASYFFSLWSLRQILSSQIHTFPTIFDLWILSISMLLILLLAWKVLGRTNWHGG
jgi:hypothetical protein